MGKKNDGGVIHRLKSRSWWDGSVTALCGRRFAAGEYDRLVLAWLDSSPRCPTCHRRAR